jgi:hypothetical protein
VHRSGHRPVDPVELLHAHEFLWHFCRPYPLKMKTTLSMSHLYVCQSLMEEMEIILRAF